MMDARLPGYGLLIGGFLAGAYAASLDVEAIDWSLFLPAALAAAAGLFLIKRAARGQAMAEDLLSANKAELEQSLGAIINELETIIAGRNEIGTGDLRFELDRRLRDELRRFVAARSSMVHLFGVQAYADIMSAFAAGERNVNRVWSASTDGYRAEALDYLDRALLRFRESERLLHESVARVR